MKITMTTMTTTQKKTKIEKPIPTLPTNPFVFEIFDLVSKQRSNSKKIEVLQKYSHDSVKSLLIWNFDDSVISLLPEGPVPYGEIGNQNVFNGTLSDNLLKEAVGGESATGQDLDGRNKTSLRIEYTVLYNFVKGGNNHLSSIRREMMFINLLQGLHPKESEILILVKDGKLEDKYKIPFNVVKEAYPDIRWGGRS